MHCIGAYFYLYSLFWCIVSLHPAYLSKKKQPVSLIPPLAYLMQNA